MAPSAGKRAAVVTTGATATTERIAGARALRRAARSPGRDHAPAARATKPPASGLVSAAQTASTPASTHNAGAVPRGRHAGCEGLGEDLAEEAAHRAARPNASPVRYVSCPIDAATRVPTAKSSDAGHPPAPRRGRATLSNDRAASAAATGGTAPMPRTPAKAG